MYVNRNSVYDFQIYNTSIWASNGWKSFSGQELILIIKILNDNTECHFHLMEKDNFNL